MVSSKLLNSPEFDALLKDINRRLRKYLHVHARYLSGEHDDLVQTALADFAKLAGRSPTLPPPNEAHALALTILRRRIADRHRRQIAQIAMSTSLDELAEIPSSVDTERAIAMKQLLMAVVGELAALSADDRTLLLRDEFPSIAAAPLGAMERKRLSRLRERIRNHLKSTLGADVLDFLED